MNSRGFLLVAIAFLLLPPLAARAVTDTWDGGGVNSLLTLDANWVDNTAPVSDLANTDLIFAGTTQLTPALNASFSTRSITFNNTAGAFVIDGQPFDVGSGGIVNNDSQTMTFNNRIRFSGVANATINAAAGGLNFGDAITGPSDTLTVTGANTTSFVDFFTPPTVNKLGTGTMRWAPTANAGIDLTIGAGAVAMVADGSPDLFTSSSSVAVNGTSTFSINESLTLDGAQLTRASGASLNIAAGKTLTVQNGGDAMITDNFISGTASTIVVTGAGSTFSTTAFLALSSGSILNVLANGDVSSGGVLTLAGATANVTATVDGTGSTLSGTSLVLSETSTVTFTNNSTGTFTSALSLGNFVADSATSFLNIESGADVIGASLGVATVGGMNTGTVTVTGAGSTLGLSGAGSTTIGAASMSSGTLNVNNGAIFNSGTGATTVNRTGLVSISGGIFNVNGNLTVNGTLNRDATGTLTLDPGTNFTVQNGGDVNITGGTFGVDAAVNIAVTGIGSTISTTNSTAFNGGSTVNISGGGQVSSGTSTLNIGTNANGTVTVDGAGSNLTSGSLNIGNNGATGTLTFTNGSSGTFAGIGLAEVGAVQQSHATLSIQSGATVTGTGLATDPPSPGSTATVTVSGTGSMLTLSGAASAGIGASTGGGSGTLRVENGGTFTSGTGPTTVRTNGTIEIAGGNYVSRGDLTVSGGFLNRSAGTFDLAAMRTLSLTNGGRAVFSGSFATSNPSTIRVTGTNSRFSASTSFVLQSGSTMNVLAGGRLDSGFIRIGVGTGDGTLTIDGAASSVGGSDLVIGENGRSGIVIFADGSTGQFSRILVDAAAPVSTFGLLSIQNNSTVESGRLDVATAATSTTGAVTVAGAGSALTLSGVATIGAASGSDGTVHVSSGALFGIGSGTSNLHPTGTIRLDNSTLDLEGQLVAAGTLTILGTSTIQGPGSLAKTGLGTLTLPNANSYEGGTALRGGTIIAGAIQGALGSGNVVVESGATKLSIPAGVVSAIADNGTLFLAGGGTINVADFGFAELAAGVNEILSGLILGVEVQPPGTYGSTSSGAAFRSNEFFSGPGILTVIPEPGTSTILLCVGTALFGLQRFRRS